MVVSASPLTVTKLACNPQNEGARTTYEIHFKTQNTISSDETIRLIFPPEFDLIVGENLRCWAVGLVGTLTCTAKNRYINIIGHQTLAACATCTVELFIYGVTNP